MYSKDIIEGYRAIFSTASIADACDQLIGETMFLPFSIKNRINEKKIVGPAVTILEDVTQEKLPPQHALDAIDESEEGSVIVITGCEALETVAVWGGLMTAGAVANKHEGAVLNGGLRDIAEIRRDYDFPVYSKTVTPGTTLGRFKTIDANKPVEIGGVTINPGDLIIGDVDGVVCVPKDKVEAVLELSKSIDERELEQAKLIIDSGSLRDGLAKYGRI
ncbi:4-hydroxy-4-methyl-2-oxoglutarate aldolase [Pseudovibrio sp. W64]|jgi:regulator of RNase E activity RraA|uniref:RraA family protein n=1 Tax=unclassified Pseudovibrio TaxID=2627060 RepID=UPI0007AE6498|nr:MULTISPECIES: RraA family protein [unclassified Pseudovibrio]KZK78141.1 4-hydroxy-4-methyl-2-oxoglutarate aldolase [Pseudovibrio sp. W64]KZK95205.1 4-hydroxy-4-methyl-2-oxoglutarate aldolase [Pseudovibrio sp. W74]KZL09022.1 4-hydroxy-4-methyl-2-oxoglutarate aldolase [Pseudovibrio sp. Ad14]